MLTVRVLRVLAAPLALLAPLAPVALLALAPLAPSAPLAPLAPLSLYLLGHRIGTEQSTITTEGSASVLSSHFSFVDRTANVTLDTTLKYAADFTPLSFESHGRTYRLFPVEVSLPQVASTPRTFTAEGVAPLAVQGLLVRYWLAHGQPAAITTLPSGDSVTVRESRTAPALAPALPRLREFTIDGLAWGRQRIWLRAGTLDVAAAVTSAGVLGFEAIASDLEPALPVATLIQAAVRERLVEASRESRAVQPRAGGTFALLNARLIDGTGAPAIENATVLVRDGHIAAAGPGAATPVPPGVTRIDVTGKSVLPGLWDMHAHVGLAEWGPVYLASGVTTVRDMGGEFGVVTALRDAWGDRRAIGPRMLLAGLVDGPGAGSFGHVTAANPEEGRAAVARYKAAGFQQMKLYSLLDRPTSAAIIDAAHAAGMTVTGHIPTGLDMRTIVEMGMDQIAHLTVRDAPESDALRETVAFLKSRGTVIDPTLSWNEMLGRSLHTSLAEIQPRASHVAAPLRRMLDSANGGAIPPAQATARMRRSLQIVKALHDAGVPIVAGTDKGVPGISLAREIELYVEAGLSPMDAIRAATAVPARVMGLAKETGTIAVGLAADLIVVDGNPLQRIADIENVRLVSSRGRLYDASLLWRAGGFR